MRFSVYDLYDLLEIYEDQKINDEGRDKDYIRGVVLYNKRFLYFLSQQKRDWTLEQLRNELEGYRIWLKTNGVYKFGFTSWYVLDQHEQCTKRFLNWLEEEPSDNIVREKMRRVINELA